MGSPWENLLRAFQETDGHEVTPPELREEPASIEPGKTTSTPQEGAKKRSTVRKARKGQPTEQ